MITKIDLKNKSIVSYAIRKLTPKECFRLMGVRDETIKIMQSSGQQFLTRVPNAVLSKFQKKDLSAMVISKSQQLKMAGNSIVVDVLTAIYEQLWYPKNKADKIHEKIIITTFSGYDSQLMACDVLKEKHPDFKYTCEGWSEIDKFACQMHNLIFPQYKDKALGDITQVDWKEVKNKLNGKEVDLLTYSSPCQDISIAGKQAGLQIGSGTRSSLLWHVASAIEELRPKYLLLENVAALVSKKFMPDFTKWLETLGALGYVNVWTRLNAKDFGIPQNRDRVFCLSMRKDVAFDFEFPKPVPLACDVEYILEDNVCQEYFIKDKYVSLFVEDNVPTDKYTIFTRFDIITSQESAMFLKTWLQMFMNDSNGWSANACSACDLIESAKDAFYIAYNKWKVQNCFPSNTFKENFKKNLKRYEF